MLMDMLLLEAGVTLNFPTMIYNWIEVFKELYQEIDLYGDRTLYEKEWSHFYFKAATESPY